MNKHNNLRKIERAAIALWRSTEGEGPRVSEATQDKAVTLYNLTNHVSWSLWNAMRANYLKALQEPRHGGSRLHVLQAREFARDVLFIIDAMHARDPWELRVMQALIENQNLTLPEAAKIAGKAKSTVSRCPLFKHINWRKRQVKATPGLYDHDGAT